jgi:hypothetical protein
MLDRMIEKARQENVFSRDAMPTERRVLAAFLSHAGRSYRKIEPSLIAPTKRFGSGSIGCGICSSRTAGSEAR